METRCPWAGNDLLYCQYHDQEWGVPVHEDQKLFEFLLLEGAQAGLSWITILRKREHYREVFDQFDPEKIAAYDKNKVEALLVDPGIVRNRLKVQAAITNAKAFLCVQQEFGSFDHYLWSFVNGTTKVNYWETLAEVPATTKESDDLSRELKKRGFTFVGSTICYALMQAVGMVDDHLVNCFRHEKSSLR